MKTTFTKIGSLFAWAFIAAGILSASDRYVQKVKLPSGQTAVVAECDSDRFLQKVKLPSGQFAVVAEGDFEPHSLGSYSVRLYSGKQPEFPCDDFVAGILRERPDGYIEKVMLTDIDGNDRPEIVVIFRCIGSGQYLSAEAFSIDKKGLHVCATVQDLGSAADPVKALKKKRSKK